MSILLSGETSVLVQGITGNIGSFQTAVMQEYGTNVVAGVTPGKGGEETSGIPVYDFVSEAVGRHEVDAAISYVPSKFARDAALEAIDAGIKFIVMTAEGVPVRDMMAVLNHAEGRGATVLGPDTPGLISPGKSKLGVHPDRMTAEGDVGVLSRSGALSYEICKSLTEKGIGQSTVVGIGGGPLWGMTQVDVLKLFEEDPETKVIVLAGEVGGSMEQKAAEYIDGEMTKPVVSIVVGRSAPAGKRLGHAGAIVEGNAGRAADKIDVLSSAGAKIGRSPGEVAKIVDQLRG
ncbi:succinate--CoA ligase subunit alpha [Candidatus Bipolaricaulota bacterium]|nr:succinate--CoA ligase subunit alpha [Candidatus Bipolaricaulota bacterium]